MIEVRKDTMDEFMGLYIDFWQFLYLPSDLRIKKKEREFMMHTLVLNAKGIDITSTEYVQHMIPRMQLRTANEVYNYRSRLKNKGFLLEEDGKVILPQGLNVKEVPAETYFQFKVHCDEPTQFKRQKPIREIKSMSDLDRPIQPPKDTRPKLPDIDAEVQLPPPPTGDVETRNDPLREISHVANQMAREARDQYILPRDGNDGEEVRVPKMGTFRKGGYSSDEYAEFDRNRSQSKLPPIPGLEDEISAGGNEESRYIDNINTGNAGNLPAPVRERSVPHVRKNIINLDDDA